MARIVAHLGAPVREIAHLAGEAGGHPLVIPGTLRNRLGTGHAGELEAAPAGQLANIPSVQISSPTERINSMALLLRTTPGRMT